MFNPVITSANASQYFAAARRAKTLFSADRYTWDYSETDLDAVDCSLPRLSLWRSQRRGIHGQRLDGNLHLPRVREVWHLLQARYRSYRTVGGRNSVALDL